LNTFLTLIYFLAC